MGSVSTVREFGLSDALKVMESGAEMEEKEPPSINSMSCPRDRMILTSGERVPTQPTYGPSVRSRVTSEPACGAPALFFHTPWDTYLCVIREIRAAAPSTHEITIPRHTPKEKQPSPLYRRRDSTYSERWDIRSLDTSEERGGAERVWMEEIGHGNEEQARPPF
eukprot:Gb_18185 [translate_table: standard]